MPSRTLSPETRTMVTTMESPSRIRSDSLRERTSMTSLRANNLDKWMLRKLHKHRGQHRGLDELGFEDPLAAGTIKQDGVAVGFPDCGELDAAGSMQAKENAAGPPSA